MKKYVVMTMGCCSGDKELYIAVPEVVFDTVEEANSYVEKKFDEGDFFTDGYEDTLLYYYTRNDVSPSMAVASVYDANENVSVGMVYVVEVEV